MRKLGYELTTLNDGLTRWKKDQVLIVGGDGNGWRLWIGAEPKPRSTYPTPEEAAEAV